MAKIDYRKIENCRRWLAPVIENNSVKDLCYHLTDNHIEQSNEDLRRRLDNDNELEVASTFNGEGNEVIEWLDNALRNELILDDLAEFVSNLKNEETRAFSLTIVDEEDLLGEFPEATLCKVAKRNKYGKILDVKYKYDYEAIVFVFVRDIEDRNGFAIKSIYPV